MRIGLRIDVDTFRGTQYGVPNLCRLFDEHAIRASFFFSVGPDNMGRHLWRLIRPSFFRKMLRSKASRLYGWDVLLRGTLWPGPVIGEKLGGIISSASEAGHEIGLHAWDHHAWQVNIDTMTAGAVHAFLKRGFELLTQIIGNPPSCSAVPAWKCNDLTLLKKAEFPFSFNSDCRGKRIFYPVVRERVLPQPQIPVTLPTYDEVIGHNGISNDNYNEYMLSLLSPHRLNVLTIHAEVEGIVCLAMFGRFVEMVQSRGASFVPLGTLLKDSTPMCHAKIVEKQIQGRSGWVSCQATQEEQAGPDS